jgi:hypothetical protein
MFERDASGYGGIVPASGSPNANASGVGHGYTMASPPPVYQVSILRISIPPQTFFC